MSKRGESPGEVSSTGSGVDISVRKFQSQREEVEDKVVERSPKGRFLRFNRRIGVGSFKTVYLAFDNDTGREVAWSAVSFAHLTHHERMRIDSEIRMVSSLDSPRILKFISAWINKEKSEVVLITERVSGGSLRAYIRRLDSPLKLRVIRNWCIQILEGLVYLHSCTPGPVIHRDLKCDNIFVHGNEGNVVIGDLGLCTTLTNASVNHSLVGTPEFMAPEMYEEHYGTAVDIYAFGQIYKRVMAGRVPDDFERIKNIELKRIVMACIDSDPGRRPTADELLKDPFWYRTDDRGEVADIYGDQEKISVVDDTPTNLDFANLASDESDDGSNEFQTNPGNSHSEVIADTAPKFSEWQELQSIQRKQSVSFGGTVNSSVESGAGSTVRKDSIGQLPPLGTGIPHKSHSTSSLLTKELLHSIPETAQVESACRLLGMRHIPSVELFLEAKPGFVRRVLFDYTLSSDTPARIAQQLDDAGLITPVENGGPDRESVISQINDALLARVQQIVNSNHVNRTMYTQSHAVH